MFSGWSASWKEYRLPESVRGTREFVWRHKYKLLGGTGVVAGALWYYDCLPFVSSSSSSTTSPSSDTGSRAGGGGGVTRPRLNPGTRSRLLLRVRKHFDFAVNDFLPILATKTDTAVDVDTARKQIQALRASGAGVESILSEEKLWEEIKVSSVSLLIVSVYMMSMVCILLRIQLHIIARNAPDFISATANQHQRGSRGVLSPDLSQSASASASAPAPAPSSSSSSSPTSSSPTSSSAPAPIPTHVPSSSASVAGGSNDAMGLSTTDFQAIIDGTYKHVFSTGLTGLAAAVRAATAAELADWKVHTKTEVEWADFLDIFGAIRRRLEKDLPAVLALVVAPPPADTAAEAAAAAASASASATVGAPSARAREVLSQTWDVAESPMFQAVFMEAVATGFRLVLDGLRAECFAPENPAGNLPLRRPPLASLLAKVKAAAQRFLPPGRQAPHVRDVVGGAYLDALCTAVFDSDTADFHEGDAGMDAAAQGVAARPSRLSTADMM